MQSELSKIFFALSWIAVIVATLATALWIYIVADGNYVWSGLAFTALATPVLIGILLLAVIPSGILYLGARQRRDWLSLLLATYSFAAIVVEIGLLWIMPMRGE